MYYDSEAVKNLREAKDRIETAILVVCSHGSVASVNDLLAVAEARVAAARAANHEREDYV